MNNDINNNENEHYSIYSHDELEDELYEEQIQNEFNENFPEHKSSGLGMYFVYAFIFVAVLITFGVSSTYAYYTMSTGTSSSTTAITATADCIDITIDATGYKALTLPYNYPITDSFATSDSNITPYEIKIKNNCQSNIADVKYTLVLSSIKGTTVTNNLDDTKVRTKIVKKPSSGSETVVKDPCYFSSLTKINDGNRIKEILSQNLESTLSSYTVVNSYEIDSGSLKNNEEVTYKIYLWIDYYEGDSAMYNGGSQTHGSSYDNSTKDKTFSAVASVFVN